MIWLLVLWLLAFAFGVFLIAFVVFSFMKSFEKNKEKKRKQMKINCIKKAKGKIVESKQKRESSPLILTVEFQVNHEIYQFEETALFVVEKVKWKGLPIEKKGYYPFNVNVGSIVDIKYNPQLPHMAYIVNNTGSHETI